MQRRTFLKALTAGTAATVFSGLGLDFSLTEARAQEFKLSGTKLTTSVCCFCAVGCGLLVWTDPKTQRAINIEGDPDHPVNGGTLCPKGSSIWQTTEQSNRVTSVMYRASGSDK